MTTDAGLHAYRELDEVLGLIGKPPNSFQGALQTVSGHESQVKDLRLTRSALALENLWLGGVAELTIQHPNGKYRLGPHAEPQSVFRG